MAAISHSLSNGYDEAEPLHNRKLPLAAARTLLVRMLGPLGSFALAIILARAIGPAGTGAVYVTLALVAAITIVAKCGLETALQRFVGAASGRGDAAAVYGIYIQALTLCVALAVPIAGLTAMAAPLLARHLLGDVAHAAVVLQLALLVLPTAVVGIGAATLKALGRPAWGAFLEAGIWPLLTLALTMIYAREAVLTPDTIASAFLAASLIAAALALATVRTHLPATRRSAPMPWMALRAACVPLAGIELINHALLWLPFLMLPALAGVDEAGLYSAGHRLAAQLGLLMLAIASVTCGRFAAHHESGRQTELAQLAGRATRLLIALSLPPAAVLLLWGEPILELFGNEFTAALDTLRILVLGQLASLVTGPAGYLLAMTGHERALRRVLLTTAAAMLIMATVLIPLFGANGAAAAVAAAMALQSLLCAHVAARHLRVRFWLALIR